MPALEVLQDRLGRAGFQSVAISTAVSGYRRRTKERAKFGAVNTFAVLQQIEDDAAVDDLRSCSRQAFNACRTSRSDDGPANLVVVYVVFLVEHDSPAIQAFIGGYRPRHWRGQEFPVVVETATGAAHFSPRAPLWGRAYYPGYRRQATELFDLR